MTSSISFQHHQNLNYVSIDRTRQILEGLGIPVSTGTLQNFLDNYAVETASAADEIRRKVAALDVIHCDETGVDVNGKLHWMHCRFNSKWSYCTVHEKRGSAAMDEIGVIPSLDNSTLTLLEFLLDKLLVKIIKS